MNFSLDKYLEALYQSNTREYSFCASTKQGFEQWQKKFREELIVSLGGLDFDKPVSVIKLLEEEDMGDYVRQRILIKTDDNLFMPTYCLIPKGKTGKLPAVIACHGHGYGSKDIVGLSPDGTAKVEGIGYQKNFALELVRRGYLVLAPEIFCFGQRRLIEDEGKPLDYSSCNRVSTYLLMLGKTVAGMRVQEIIQLVSYLRSREDIDHERIGCMGISGGGMVCAFSSAVDERIKAAVISGYVNTYKGSILAMEHCVDNYIPGLLKKAEMPEVISLIAPRALFIEAGDKDPIFPLGGTMEAIANIKEAYKAAGAIGMLENEIFDGDHEIGSGKSYEFMEKVL